MTRSSMSGVCFCCVGETERGKVSPRGGGAVMYNILR